jgi:hypothetical protein
MINEIQNNVCIVLAKVNDLPSAIASCLIVIVAGEYYKTSYLITGGFFN